MLDAQLARLELGEIENIVDHVQQMPTGLENTLESQLHALGIGLARTDLRHPQHAIQRGADFMAHVRQELPLGLGRHLGATLLQQRLFHQLPARGVAEKTHQVNTPGKLHQRACDIGRENAAVGALHRDILGKIDHPLNMLREHR